MRSYQIVAIKFKRYLQMSFPLGAKSMPTERKKNAIGLSIIPCYVYAVQSKQQSVIVIYGPLSMGTITVYISVLNAFIIPLWAKHRINWPHLLFWPKIVSVFFFSSDAENERRRGKKTDKWHSSNLYASHRIYFPHDLYSTKGSQCMLKSLYIPKTNSQRKLTTNL